MANWKGKTKGSPLGYLFFIRVIQIFGIRFTYLILRVVTFQYVIFARKTKQNLRLFYSKIPTIEKSKINRIIRKNFNLLGESLVDKFAFLIGKGKEISYTQEGENQITEIADRKEPLILLSAHIGNWEIAGNFLKSLDTKVNVLMFDGEREKIKSLIKNEVGEVHFNIIPIKNDLSHIFSVTNAVRNGEIICVHADRYLPGAKTITTKFFGRDIELPYGPFQMAAKLKANHAFIFAVKDSKFNYHFTCSKPEKITSPEQVAANYVRILEEKVSKNPEQWFNYHPFFKEDVSQ